MVEKNFYDKKAEELLGIPAIYPYQRLVIHHLLSVQGYWGLEEEKECCPENLVIFPTGMGKSLCFMLPGMMLDGVTVVVYPLISLMEDQFRRLKERGVPVGLLMGKMKRSEVDLLRRNLRSGRLKFLLTNPEMCIGPLFRELAELGTFSQLIIDEVHTLLQWGKSFRPAMLDMGRVLGEYPFRGLHYFTATLTRDEEEQLREIIRPGGVWNTIRSPGDRPNLRYFFLDKPEKDRAAEEILRSRKGNALLFCRTRLGTEECSRELRFRLKEKDIHYYHAGLTAERKKELAQWFLDSRRGIMVATKAYGMGVDKPDIRLVIHRDFPEDISSYLQESGRAGRDGEMADSIVFLPDRISEIPGFPLKGVLEREGCRRASIFSEMGETLNHCGGCDYCTPMDWTPRLDKDRAGLLKSLLRISGLMSRSVLLDYFQGMYSPAILRSRTCFLSGFRSLAHWQREDLEACLRSLERRKILKTNPLPGKFRKLYLKKRNPCIKPETEKDPGFH